MRTVHIVGVGMNGSTVQAEEIVNSCDALLGAPKQLDVFKNSGKPTYEGYSPEDVRRVFAETGAVSVAVLVSGDVGFFSGARRLVSELGEFDVRLTAGVPSVCDFFAKLKLPWQDAALISMHGMNGPLISTVRRNRQTFCLTGGNVSEVGRLLGSAGFGGLTVYVGENLGYPDEHIFKVKASELDETQPMAVLLIINEDFDASIPTGMPDTAFIRHEDVPMTKSDIRAAIMSKLRLRPDDICYDIGAGTGSVTVEMALSAYNGRIFAVERKSDALMLAEQNCQKFHIGNVSFVSGYAPAALDNLPAPDAVFVGGSSGNFAEILDTVLSKNQGARIVATAIALETVHTALMAFEKAGLSNIEAVQIGVACVQKRGGVHMLMAQNPIFVISGGGR